MATGQAPLEEGKLIVLFKAFYLCRDKNDYFCRLQMYLFSSVCHWSYFQREPPTQFNWMSSFTLSVFRCIRVFLALDF
jgi:hypothetical protein